MPRTDDVRDRLLASYEALPPGGRNGNGFFLRLLAGTQGLLLLAGGLMLTVEGTPVVALGGDEARRVTFRFEPESAPVEITPEPRPVEPEPDPVEMAPEITPATVLDQAIDRSAPEPELESTPATTPDDPATPVEPPRRVYGVRKVFARGLGADGSGAPGLVVKRGNTVDGRADSLVATPEDLVGTLAPLSTVSRAPVPLRRVKPRYSDLLREHRATGTVTARLLVDVDGSVRLVEVTSDIGHDSSDLAEAAFRQFRFEPAIRGGEPVAVWIIHKIRFELQE